MRLFEFNNEHSATKEIGILNQVLDEMNNTLLKESHNLSRLKDRYEWIEPMQYKYNPGTAEYNYYSDKISNAKQEYVNQYNKIKGLQEQIGEIKKEINLLH